MFTRKIFATLLLVYIIRCEDSCFQQFTCEWEKAQRGHDILVTKADTDEVCAKKCCENKQCVGFDWVITTKGCYLTKTLRAEVPLTDLRDTWSCEKKALAPGTCEVNPESRVECGWAGISKATCEGRGCCFNSNWGGVKWCYKKDTSNSRCMVNPENRKECGWSGITRQQCESKPGCCFNNKTPGMKWCYKEREIEDHFGGICHRDFKKIGCFRRDWKLLTDLLITDLDPTHPNYTIPMNWDNFGLGIHSLACRCREKAKGHYKYFAMGFHAECVAGKDTAALEKMMAKDKDSGHGCINGELAKCDKTHKAECSGVADYDFFYEITHH